MQRRVRRRGVRQGLRVTHVRLRLAVRDLRDVAHGLALGELSSPLVQLAPQPLLAARHVFDFAETRIAAAAACAVRARARARATRPSLA
eukprot:CAMPEP_0117627038 /NCGR_PEP_ID=MMETSP0802-20121206/1731_1 /TAXON_ID=38833 /ORGANISM="Micromonas sp., Strain CCMP2099" /LENGTH=88 /DNA_ID=CAMNT_0005431179 /DNA_START=1963 /DNA_END=2226 /DNA_ORIENTATION=-